MSGEKVVIHLLLADTSVGGLVEDDSIEPGVLSQGGELPALSVEEVSAFPARLAVKEGAWEAITTRVQVTAYAETYPQLMELLEAVRRACGHRRGTIAGVDVRNCRVDLQGPDMKTEDDQVYMKTLDVLVTWMRAL